jgi:DNA repair photolyase
MYPEWTPWKVLAGICPHDCDYCATNTACKRTPEARRKYSGEPRVWEPEMTCRKKGRGYFVASTRDLVADGVPAEVIKRILGQCRKYPESRYLFQTKNPQRFAEFLDMMPPDRVLGTTIETNRNTDRLSKAPSPEDRARAMAELHEAGMPHLQVTIEPILDFDVFELMDMIISIEPEVVYVGADTKGHHLPEPSPDKIKALLNELGRYKETMEVRVKENLNRLLGIPKKPKAPEVPKAAKNCMTLDEFDDDAIAEAEAAEEHYWEGKADQAKADALAFEREMKDAEGEPE